MDFDLLKYWGKNELTELKFCETCKAVMLIVYNKTTKKIV